MIPVGVGSAATLIGGRELDATVVDEVEVVGTVVGANVVGAGMVELVGEMTRIVFG